MAAHALVEPLVNPTPSQSKGKSPDDELVLSNGNTSELYYKRLFENAPIGIFRKTLDGQLIDGNPALVAMLGFTDLADLKQVNFNSLYAEPNPRSVELTDTAKLSQISVHEYKLQCANGEHIYVRETAKAFRDEKGEILFIEGTLEDVSEKIQTEEELRKYQNRVESEQAQRQLAETLHEVSRTINSTLNLNEVLENVLSSLETLVRYDRASLSLRNAEGINAAGQDVTTTRGQSNEYTIMLDQNELMQKAMLSGKLLLVSDTKDYSWLENFAQTRMIRSWLGAPLKSRGEVIGLLVLESQCADCYGKRETEIAQAFANQVAISIDNARLYETTKKRANELSALRATSADITAELELNKLLQSILARALNLINASGGELGLYDENSRTITIAACQNMGKDTTGQQMKLGEGALGAVIESKEPLLLSGGKNRNVHIPSNIDWRYRGVIAAPLLVKDKVLGVIALTDVSEDQHFSEKHLQLLTMFAQQAAIAIENAKLFDQIQQALADTQKLYRAARSLISTLSSDEILRELLENVSEALPANQVLLYILDLREQKVIQLTCGGPGANQISNISFDELWGGLTGWAIRKRQPVLSLKGENDPRENKSVQERRRRNNSGSIIVVPLQYRDEILGSITAINRIDQRDFTQRDVELISTIANHVSTTIKNAQLFEQIQHLAETDELTGVHNRRQLFILGEREFIRSRRYQTPLSVVMLDIDNFKLINDTFGHATGDEVLQALTSKCSEEIRNVDIFGRYGGEEFAIVLPDTPIDKTQTMVERIRESIAKTPITTKSGAIISITVSIGIAEIKPSVPDLATLIDRADTALYIAKNGGKNRVELFG